MVLVLGSGKNVRTVRTAPPAAGRPGRLRSLCAIGRRWLAWNIHRLSAWREIAASQRDLATLNEYYLKDLGLSRHDFPPDSSPPSRLW
jgi:uncharacterized protein YjiS (DUF1127 family)